MATIKTLVCAIDLSDPSAGVADYAITMSKAFDAKIIVVYATPPLNQYAALEVQPKALEVFGEEISAGAGKQMEKIMSTLFAGVSATPLLKEGNPSEEIIAAAKENNADMIIMGTHGRKGVDLMLFGSVAEKVVKNAKLPVLTVNPNK